jgi:hypothetical protein
VLGSVAALIREEQPVIELRHDAPLTPASICSFMLEIEHWNLSALREPLIFVAMLVRKAANACALDPQSGVGALQ